MQEKLVANNYYLNKSAKDAYRSYILAYNSHSMKDIFNVHRLDLQVPSSSCLFFFSRTNHFNTSGHIRDLDVNSVFIIVW